MNPRILTLTFLLGAVSAFAQKFDPETPYQVKNLSSDNIDQVEAKTNGGNISLQSVDNGESRIEVYIWPSNNKDRNMTKEQVQQRLNEYYDLSIDVHGHTLTAEAKTKPGFHSWKNGLSISYRIFLPKEASSMLRTSGGNIVIKGMKGSKQDFTTSGGNLEVEDLAGKIIGRTSGGNIRVKNASDDIDLSTSGGNIDAQQQFGPGSPVHFGR